MPGCEHEGGVPGGTILPDDEMKDFAKSYLPDGFEKNSRSRLANLEERGVLLYAAMTRDTRNADIGLFTKPS